MTDRSPSTEPVDDAMIAALVRDIARAWTMPRLRPDASTWRDRVDARQHRWEPGRIVRRGSRRLVGAAFMAVVGTVALTSLAVWLAIPRGADPVGGSTVAPAQSTAPSAAPGAIPPASPVPSATPFPALAVFGAPLPDTRLLVASGSTYRVLDMKSGLLGRAVVTSDEAANDVVLFDGRGLCLCGTYSTQDRVDYLTIEIRWLGADGAIERIQPVGTYAGWAGPTAAGTTLRGVYARGTLSPDGNRFIVGRTSRELSAWRSGIDLVDLSTGHLAEAVTLPDLPLLANATTVARPSPVREADVYPGAPRIAISPDGLRFMATQYVTVADEVRSVHRFSGELDVDGGAILFAPTVTGPGTLGAEDCFLFPDEAFASNDVYAGFCSSSGQVFLRRVAPDGSPIGDTDLPALELGGFGFLGKPEVVDRSAAIAYFWTSANRTVVKVDLPSGRVLAQATLLEPTALNGDPPGAPSSLGRSPGSWLAPTTLANVYLDPALALSPDGSRLYLLGTHLTDATDAAGGSAGVWAVDTATLGVLGHWEPAADFVSIAVSRDGSYVYATGVGLGSGGADGSYEAFVTAFDAADGSIRAIVGMLGPEGLSIRGVLAP